MKHYIVGFFFIIFICYYFIGIFQEKTWFEDTYISVKQELITEEENQNNNQDNWDINAQEAKIIKNEKSHDLRVDFYSQSPFWKWWPVFEDTCEEASVLLALNYVRDDYMNKIQFRDELLKIVDWENKVFWDFKDTNVDETAQILENFYNFTDYEIKENPSIEEMKTEISQWNIIIAPVYGIWLNPNYGWIWPDYHFLVIKWYTDNSFISHDVGTARWENYIYNQETLYNRIHDYHPENIELGEKKIIILKKSN